ncbi:RNA-guided pseudouridylation complex pseudouridine synthase subunit Cbf5 [Candidatus Pacearchaeota archaeon]|nr:RNA-guided pseudouridylation complex pseudouridine synthase subunit Cbf5 [Candidatus Pacearchaeota archaeon]
MNQKPISDLLKFSIINIDKPAGPTSFSISEFIKKSFDSNKTSHFGTLDPAVSGVLPIALSRACRLSDYFMHKEKEYVGIMRLHSDVSEDKLKKAIKEFIGKITQLPPKRSRVKRAERIREIKKFEILEIQGKDVLFLTEVQAGTYIRKLCHDIGKNIGGAHMFELRRTRAGIFSEKDKNFIDLYEFEKIIEEYKKGNDSLLKKILIPAEEAILKVLPHVRISEKNLKQLLTGKPVTKSDLLQNDELPKEDKFAIFCNAQFIGIYHKTNEKEIIARAEFVFN